MALNNKYNNILRENLKIFKKKNIVPQLLVFEINFYKIYKIIYKLLHFKSNIQILIHKIVIQALEGVEF